jgi:hypothetical protein
MFNRVLLAGVACFALSCTSAQAQDFALKQPATASRTERGLSQYRPAKANDGNSSTRWSSNYADNQWWQVDLGSIRSINRVDLNWEAAYARRYRIRTRTSTRKRWSTAARIRISTPGLHTHMFPTRNARYVRIEGDVRATTWGISLWYARVCNISCMGPSPPPPTGGDGDGVPPDTTPPARTFASRPFPRLMMTHYRIADQADANRLARWDWVVVGESDPGTVALTSSLRTVNPNIKVTPYVDGTEDNGYRFSTTHVSPTAYASGFSDDWWLKNYDGSYANYPHSPGRRMLNPTQFAAVVNGKQWNDHLAHWIGTYSHHDGVLVDMVSDSSVNAWPRWKLTDRVPNVDLDRNGVRDISEHGTDWVNQQWGAGVRDLMSKVRAAIGSDQLLVGNNGIGFNGWANGLSMEAGNTDNNELNLFQGWIDNHFGTHYTTQQTQGGTQTNYRLMRHNLAAAMMADAYFNYSDGAAGNYTTLWWYDEYSIDVATGRPTGDASKKGYLGQATGPAVQLADDVWRRDFEHGIALVNNSSSTQTVSLGGTFRRILGTQDPTVNSGASVSTASLPPWDAVILLR